MTREETADARRSEESERSERARTSVHVVARGEAWFVGGPCTPDRCNPLGTRCSAKPYSFLSAVRHPTSALCLSTSARSPLPTALPRALVAVRVFFRVYVHLDARLRSVMRVHWRDRESRCSKKFRAKDPCLLSLFIFLGQFARLNELYKKLYKKPRHI